MKTPIAIKMEVLGGISYTTHPSAYTPAQTQAFTDKIRSQINCPEEDVIDFIATYGSGRFNAEVRIPPKEQLPSVPYNCFRIQSVASRDMAQASDRLFLLFHGEQDSIVYYSLEQQSLGKIFYWKHENGINNSPVLLADSFKECITALYSHDKAPVYVSSRTLLPG